MLSIEETRNLIEGDEKYSNEEIEKIQNELNSLAEMAIDSYVSKKSKSCK